MLLFFSPSAHSFKLYSLWMLIQILLSPWLPGSIAVDIEPCKTKIVLLDIKDNRKDYIIPYEVCKDQDSVCHLSNGKDQCYDPTGIPGVGIMKKVYLNTERDGKIMKLPHDSETFNVSAVFVQLPHQHGYLEMILYCMVYNIMLFQVIACRSTLFYV